MTERDILSLAGKAGYRDSGVWCQNISELHGSINHGVDNLPSDVLDNIIRVLLEQGRLVVITSNYPSIYTTPEKTLGWMLHSVYWFEHQSEFDTIAT